MPQLVHSLRRSDGFTTASYLVAGVGLLAALGAAIAEPSLALLPLAALLGWCQLSSV